MSNFDRAVKALNDVDEAIDHLADNEAYVAALEAAGLLAPDLPAPGLPGLWEVGELVINAVDKDGDVLIEWDEESDYSYYGTQTRNLWLNREQVLAILAAAPELAQELSEETWEYAVQVKIGAKWLFLGRGAGGHSFAKNAFWFDKKEKAQGYPLTHGETAPTRIVRRRVSPPEVINE